MNTFTPKAESIKRNWYLIDMAGKNLGRTASEIARVLCGKNKPEYATHIDTGDFVIVTNAGKLAVTGNKMTDKMYRRHSGYPGGLREDNLKSLLEKHPERAIEIAVRGMLPKNKLRDPRMKRLKVYTTENHPHHAQQPVELKI